MCAAMKPDAPVLHEDQFTKGVDPKPEKPSNIAARMESKLGDIEKGRKLKSSSSASSTPNRSIRVISARPALRTTPKAVWPVWTGTQGHFVFRAQIAKLLKMDMSK